MRPEGSDRKAERKGMMREESEWMIVMIVDVAGNISNAYVKDAESRL